MYATLLLSLNKLYFYFQMSLYAVLAISRMLALFIFSFHDTTCVMFERASVIDCHQDVMMPSETAKVWILIWIILSLMASVIFLCVCCRNTGDLLYYPPDNALKKGSFSSIIILLIITVIYYVYRVFVTPPGIVNEAISVFLLFWPGIMVGVMYRLNYTCPPTGNAINFERCRGRCSFNFKAGMCCVFYWVSLAAFFLEVMCKWIAVALDAANQVAPLIEKKFGDESRIEGAVILLLGFRMTFHSHLLFFFWNKMFHGDKDLFSEPFKEIKDATNEQGETP